MTDIVLPIGLALLGGVIVGTLTALLMEWWLFDNSAEMLRQKQRIMDLQDKLDADQIARINAEFAELTKRRP